MVYAIYIRRFTKFAPREVLLTDGAFTNQDNCYKPPIVFRPQLFATKAAAKRFAESRGLIGKCVRKYDGPRDQQVSIQSKG